MRKGNNNIVISLLRSSSGGSHVMWQFVGHGFPDNNERTKSPDLWIHAPCSPHDHWKFQVVGGGGREET